MGTNTDNFHLTNLMIVLHSGAGNSTGVTVDPLHVEIALWHILGDGTGKHIGHFDAEVADPWRHTAMGIFSLDWNC